MSVCIALLPIVLAMRLVMGKDNFQNWVKAQQIVVPSTFTREAELARAVKKAGYDVTKFGSSIKTHLDGHKAFFFWEFVNGYWQAVFSKHHDKLLLERFMADVEAAAGAKVFEIPAVTTVIERAQFPTNFRDGEILMQALSDFGAQPVKSGTGKIVCRFQQSELRFSQSGNAPFSVEIRNSPRLEEIYHYLDNIDEDYKRCVQTAVYEKILARAAERNMVVESEEVLPDKTIVLTLQVL